MTQEKNIVLSSEEQAKLAEKNPELLAAIKKGSPAAKGWLMAWRREQNSLAVEAKAQAGQIMQEVVAATDAAGPEQGNLLTWCGFPTDMTRMSPFFPMNPNELGNRKYLQNYLISSGAWGELKYTGPQLSTYDEDVLLALLAILDKESKYRKTVYCVVDKSEYNLDTGNYNDKLLLYDEQCDGFFSQKTYKYKGPMSKLLKLLGKQRPGKIDYTRVILSLERLATAGIKMEISTWKTKKVKRRAPRKIQMCTMLAGVFWDDEIKELSVAINPFFYETYYAGRVTLMDVAKRMSLKGAISKALYRFVQSHKANPVFAGHFLTLADALNMEREQPAFKLRQQLKTAINELIRHGVLMKKSGFVDTEIIKLSRTPEALPPTATRMEKKHSAFESCPSLKALGTLSKKTPFG